MLWSGTKTLLNEGDSLWCVEEKDFKLPSLYYILELIPSIMLYL